MAQIHNKGLHIGCIALLYYDAHFVCIVVIIIMWAESSRCNVTNGKTLGWILRSKVKSQPTHGNTVRLHIQNNGKNIYIYVNVLGVEESARVMIHALVVNAYLICC